MSKYTTEVRWICENAYRELANLNPLLPPLNEATLNSIIAAGCDKIFWKNSETDIAMNYNNEFPIYDENHRLELCFKIIKHYYTREIGAETFALWKLWINERMNEIMPFYNQLYESADVKYNPLYNTEYSRTGNKNDIGSYEKEREKANNKVGERSNIESRIKENIIENARENQNTIGGNEENLNEHTGDTLNNSSGTNTNSGNERKVNQYSDTPQNGLANVIDGRYLTNAEVNDTDKHDVSENANEETEHQETEDKNVTNYNSNKIENETGRSKQNENNTNSKNENENISENENENERGNNNNAGVWEEVIKGKIGDKTYAKMIMEYRDAILNIDKMIIDELKDLFFYLW